MNSFDSGDVNPIDYREKYDISLNMLCRKLINCPHCRRQIEIPFAVGHTDKDIWERQMKVITDALNDHPELAAAIWQDILDLLDERIREQKHIDEEES